MLHARRLSVALLSIAALAAAGCGGDDSGGGGDDESQVREVVTSYTAAIADGDGDKACGYLSENARAEVDKAAQTLKADGCAGVLEKAAEGATDAEVEKVKNIEVTSVKITGDRATAQTKVEGESGTPAILIKEDGDWKIAPDESKTATAETPTAATVTAP